MSESLESVPSGQILFLRVYVYILDVYMTLFRNRSYVMTVAYELLVTMIF